MQNENEPNSTSNHVVSQDVDSTNTSSRKGKLLDLVVIIIVIILISLVEAGYFPQRHLGFVCRDPLLSYPYWGDTISTTALLVISYSFPLLYIIIMEFIRGERGRKLLFIVIKWYREFLIGINITLVVCQLSKVLTGELRPHFFATCAPDVADNCTAGAYISDYVCTSNFTKRLVKDSFRSFPSGHTAVSTYATAFVAYYVHYRYNLRDWGNWIKPMTISFTLLWAAFASFSRLTDNRHHAWDVLAGFLIGIFASIYTVKSLCKNFIDLKKPVNDEDPRAIPLLTVR